MKLFAVLFACVCLSASALQLRQEGLPNCTDPAAFMSKVSTVIPATSFTQAIKYIQENRDTMEASDLDIVAKSLGTECHWWCWCQASDPEYPRCCKCYGDYYY